MGVLPGCWQLQNSIWNAVGLLLLGTLQSWFCNMSIHTAKQWSQTPQRVFLWTWEVSQVTACPHEWRGPPVFLEAIAFWSIIYIPQTCHRAEKGWNGKLALTLPLVCLGKWDGTWMCLSPRPCSSVPLLCILLIILFSLRLCGLTAWGVGTARRFAVAQQVQDLIAETWDILLEFLNWPQERLQIKLKGEQTTWLIYTALNSRKYLTNVIKRIQFIGLWNEVVSQGSFTLHIGKQTSPNLRLTCTNRFHFYTSL